jgi:hypothetical protein
VRLAWESGSEAIQFSAPAASVEGDKVRPDRRLIDGTLFHKRDKLRGCRSFPFDVSGSSVADSKIFESSAQAFIEHADAGTEGKAVEGM